jgi:hypothetical protein
MRPRFCLLAVVAACGSVSEPTPDAGPDAPPATVYRGTLADTPPVMFGGDPYCTYNMVLRQIEISAEVAANGQIVGGAAQNLNVESVVPTTPPCPYTPAEPSITRYTFGSASAAAGITTVMLEPDPANAPIGTLVIELLRTAAGYDAAFDYHRTDQPPPLDWRVTGELKLTRN